MIVDKVNNYTRGWIIGDFLPSLVNTKDFEIAILSHSMGEFHAPHYHKIATEYNILLSGKMKICGKDMIPGDIFILLPNEVADPVFLEDCTVVCIKIPSVIGDKYMVNNQNI